MPKKSEKVAINLKAHRVLNLLLKENPLLAEILFTSKNEMEAMENIKKWVLDSLLLKPNVIAYYKRETSGRHAFEKLDWQSIAAIRILDYIDNAGQKYTDLNKKGEVLVNNVFKYLWLAACKGIGGAEYGFFIDLLYLFRQFSGKLTDNKPDKQKVLEWMEKYPSGLDENVIKVRKENKDRIIKIIIKQIDKGEVQSLRYTFQPDWTFEQKYFKVLNWWETSHFHLKFAIRNPKLLNEMLNNSLTVRLLEILYSAEKAGIPFFVNPYFLSLIDTRIYNFSVGADYAMRDYLFYSKQLLEEYGEITAWEKEDTVKPGKPNAAGWILPSLNNIHRRYPEVAILIPDTMGRACGGLCVSCQRMYDFQSGHLNFNLNKLKPKETWPQKLERLMLYFEEDSQLRDILITGGDAFMSTNQSLKLILEAVYNMAVAKKRNNQNLPEGQKYAEMMRVRLGTRLPIYLPQRFTPELIEILRQFKEKASQIGIKQFIVQTHFISPMEITPESKKAVELLISAGWTVVNQLVFTTAASRRGNSAKIRKDLHDLGVINYYTFTVKGFRENYHNFATNARAVQEQLEEKVIGKIPKNYFDEIKYFPENAQNMKQNIDKIRKQEDLPFLATDRNVLNLPGVGKSLTFRVIGLTRSGRRILEFEHDHSRIHSPIIIKMGRVIIIESKSIAEYFAQLECIGENPSDYETIFGYSIGETERVTPIFQYPEYDFKTTEKFTNLEINSI
jgi:lysine 2,3-aminomutase